MKIPFLKRSEIAELDRKMVEEYNISTGQMMEFAGYFVAKFVHAAKAKRVLVVCGKGNNGGDGICAARHLSNFGIEPKVFLVEKDLKEEAKKQLTLLNKIGIKVFYNLEELEEEAKNADLIIDALLGYNLEGKPKWNYAEVIDIINETTAATVSIDVPSGFDCEKGEASEPCIRADEVICLSFPKFGLDKHHWGIYVAYMGLPQKLMKDYGFEEEISGLKLVK